MKLAIREYLTPQGKNPFREWLKTLDVGVKHVSRQECCDLKTAIWAITKMWAVESGRHVWILDRGIGYTLEKMGAAVILLLAGGDKASQSKRYRRGKTLLERL